MYDDWFSSPWTQICSSVFPHTDTAEPLSPTSCYLQLSQTAQTCGEYEIRMSADWCLKKEVGIMCTNATSDSPRQQIISSLGSLIVTGFIFIAPTGKTAKSAVIRSRACLTGGSQISAADENRPLEAHRQQKVPGVFAFAAVNATECKQRCISSGDMLARVMQAAAAYPRLNWTQRDVNPTTICAS